jgi:hypothetical protein
MAKETNLKPQAEEPVPVKASFSFRSYMRTVADAAKAKARAFWRTVVDAVKAKARAAWQWICGYYTWITNSKTYQVFCSWVKVIVVMAVAGLFATYATAEKKAVAAGTTKCIPLSKGQKEFVKGGLEPVLSEKILRATCA